MHSRPLPILLIEDNDDDVLMVQEAFATARTLRVVDGVKDGEQALAYLRGQAPFRDAEPPGLILLDLNMPKKDGFAVLRDIKADPSLRRVPVIILSTSSREEDIARAYAEGASSYICKPGEFHQFEELVKQFERYWTTVSRLPHRD